MKLLKFYLYDQQSRKYRAKIKKEIHTSVIVYCVLLLWNITQDVYLLADKGVSLINFSTHDILHFYLRFLSHISTVPSLYTK